MTDTENVVEAIDVHKSYGHNEVLKGISLEVSRQQVMCLLGPSGSGKSTFLRCVNHLEKIDSGELKVEVLKHHADPGALGCDLPLGKFVKLIPDSLVPDVDSFDLKFA